MNHSPIPWKIEGHPNGYSDIKYVDSNDPIATCWMENHKEDAVFIVNAVNNYHQMLSALKEIADADKVNFASQGIDMAVRVARQAIEKAGETV